MSLHPSSTTLSRAMIGRMQNLPGFRSFKTTVPIHYPQRWHRDLLIQATLDPAITRIEPLPPSQQAEHSLRICVRHADKCLLLIATREAPAIGADELSENMVILPRSSVLAEPRCSVAREIWSARSVSVPTGDRIRILRELEDSAVGVPLAKLMDCVRGNVPDPAQVVLALACVGQIEIEVRSHLTPETIFKRSSRDCRSMI